MSNTIEVKLSKPIALGGQVSAVIRFREPKVGDLIVIESVAKSGGQHAMTALMMAQLSGATQPEISEMSIPDYAACDRALRPFLRVAEEGGGD